MTKVLIFIDWYYPASKAGGPISSVLNMVNLLHENFDFFIVTGSKDLNSQNNLQDVILNNWQSVGFAKVIYLDNKYQKIKKLKEVVNKIKPDIIYVNGIFSKFFSVLPIYLFDNHYSIIVNPRGMFGEGALEIKKIKKLFFIFFTRIFSFYKNIIWHVSNINEYNQLVTNLNSKIRFYISPNIPRQIHFYKKQKKVSQPEKLKNKTNWNKNKTKEPKNKTRKQKT